MGKMLNNESMEMYLETILRLCKSNEKVRAVDIANQMRISKVSVCHAIKNLQAKDYVTYESRFIRLTPNTSKLSAMLAILSAAVL